jgi:outer membrane protein assembly factor BamB
LRDDISEMDRHSGVEHCPRGIRALDENGARSRLQVDLSHGGDVYATPVVIDNTVYAGDTSGLFYALMSRGQLVWQYKAQVAITSGALVTNHMVFFGDQGGTIYGLDRTNGQIVWSVRPNPHPLSAIWGSPTWAEGGLIFGIAPKEEDASQAPGSPYCPSRKCHL